MLFGAAVVDAANLTWSYVKRSQLIPWKYKTYVGYVDLIPWQGMMYGVFFSIALSVAVGRKQRVDGNHIGGGIAVIAISQALVPIVISLLKPIFSSVKLPLVYPITFVYAVMLAMVVRGVYFIPISGLAVVVIGLVGAVVHTVSMAKGLPIYPAQLWYSCVGLTTALFVSNYAAAED